MIVWPTETGWREEYELRLVAILLHEPARVAELYGVLTPEDLTSDKHRAYLEAILTLQERREPVEYASVWKELVRLGRFEACGGMAGWIPYLNSFTSSAHFRYYLTEILGKRHEERVASLSARIGAGERLDDEMLAELQREFTPKTNAKDTLSMTTKDMADKFSCGVALDGAALPLPWPDLTDAMLGLSAGELTLVAARPGRGKTVFLMDIARSLAVNGFPVLFYSLEMTKNGLGSRLLAAESGVDHQDIRRGRVNPVRADAVEEAARMIGGWQLWIDDKGGSSIHELRARAKAHKQEHGLAAIFVDYAQLVTDQRAERRLEELSAVSRGLKDLAKELGVPVIAAAQLNRAADGPNEPPRMSQIRECFAGSTTVINADTGIPTRVDELAAGTRILGLGKDQKVLPQPVREVWRVGRRETVEITTRTRAAVRTTRDHPVLTERGWIKAGELEIGERVAVAFRHPCGRASSASEIDLARLAGHMAGDGSCIRMPGFITNDSEALDDVRGIVCRQFPENVVSERPRTDIHDVSFPAPVDGRRRGRYKKNPIRAWLELIGMWNKRHCEKRVPEFVLRGGVKAAAAFVSGYFSSDGCATPSVDPGGTRRWRVRFDSTSRDMLRDVRLLLARMGVASSLNGGSMRGLATMPIYRLSIVTSMFNVSRFCAHVSVPGRKGRILDLCGKDQSSGATRASAFSLPRAASASLAGRCSGWRDQGKGISRGALIKRAALSGDEETRRWAGEWAQSDVIWDPVISVTAPGMEDVFDLAIDGNPTLLVNDGIVAHNCGQFEQDADCIIGLWMKDEDEQLETPTVTALVLKNRQGPGRRVELVFQKPYCRMIQPGRN